MSARLESFQAPVRALIQGASRGIGLEFVRQLLGDEHVERVFATSRAPEDSEGLSALRRDHPGRLELLALDVTEAASIEAAAQAVADRVDGLELLINVAGILHDASTGMAPEKSLRDLEPQHLRRSFAVNAIGPALMARHFHGLFRHGRRAVWANMSARVGSIGDNHLGGWYGYRASKAAQNQITRTFAIEMGRKAPETICVALHPGTVDTELSAPFQAHVPDEQLFELERAVRQLLGVIDALEPADSGAFYDWAGALVEW